MSIHNYLENVNLYIFYISEISFKCWMCGGQILIHPCSHVAHVFRDKSPYKFLESETLFVTIFRNYRRIAAVWMDEYKELIYAVNPDIRLIDGGDISSRIQLRQSLNCSSFRDYLNKFQFRNFPFTHRWIGSVRLFYNEQFHLHFLFFIDCRFPHRDDVV